MPATLVASSPIAVGTVPTDSTELWDLSRLFLASWLEGIQLDTSWPCNVVTARTAAEKRFGFTGKPSRHLRVTLRAWFTNEIWQLVNMVRRMGIARSLIPLYCDASKCTVDGSSSFLPCETANRRFYQGGHVAVATLAQGCGGIQRDLSYFRTTITNVSADGITVNSGNVVPYGAKIYPLLEVDLGLEQSLKYITSTNVVISLLAQETAGQSALPPLVDDEEDLGLSTVTVEGKTYPIFDPDVPVDGDSVDFGFSREIRSTHSGLGTIYSLIGDRPRMRRSYGWVTFERAQAFKILRMFDRCGGQLRPFFVSAPLAPWQVFAIGANSMVVRGVNPAAIIDWSAYPYVAIKRKGGGDTATQVVPISSVTYGSGNFTVNFGASLVSPPTVSEIKLASFGFLARFKDESISEKWVTSDHAQIQSECIEVLREYDVAVSGLEYVTPEVTPRCVVDAANTGQFVTTGGPCPVDQRWTVNGQPAVVTDHAPRWTTDPSGRAQWISHLCNTHYKNNVVEDYVFETTITIDAECDASTLQLPVTLAASNYLLDVRVNGVSTGVSSMVESSTFLQTFILTGSDGLVPGANVIQFFVRNLTGTLNKYHGILVHW